MIQSPRDDAKGFWMEPGGGEHIRLEAGYRDIVSICSHYSGDLTH